VCDRLLAGGLRLVYGIQIVICHWKHGKTRWTGSPGRES